MSAKKIVNLLKRKKLKISLAESCTGGMLSSAVTSVSGASKVFTMSLVTYSNQAKTSILKVPKKLIRKHGAVSKQCCLSMVNNLSKISNIKNAPPIHNKIRNAGIDAITHLTIKKTIDPNSILISVTITC